MVSLSTATIARLLRLAGVSYLGLVAGFSASAPRLSLQPRRALAHQLRGGASSATMADAASVLKQQRASWQQTMLRIKDPVKSVAFYRDVMGMTLIDKLEFPDMTFDLYFLTTLPEGETYPHTPGTDEAHKYLWTMKGATLELTHNYGTEKDESFKYHPGNGEKDGFGHVAFNTADVYAASAKLEEKGITFKKKPDEGRMKGLAFVYDPDGYWVELVRRDDTANIPNEFNLSQTMLRIKDPKKSIPFYERLGMTLCRESHFGDFSLYFLSCLPEGVTAPDPKGAEASTFVKTLFNPVLELTHNHGTETQDDFAHFNGNEADRKGFGHIGFLVDDVDATCGALEQLGATFKKKPMDGTMKGLAFAQDPDGYWIEIIKRGGYDQAATPYWKE